VIVPRILPLLFPPADTGILPNEQVSLGRSVLLSSHQDCPCVMFPLAPLSRSTTTTEAKTVLDYHGTLTRIALRDARSICEILES
jgi:hypothetical protein